ncbi:TPA: DUF551 domain-containing protein [Escherichia coli]|nr:DUF551 domain-containing protein [Escherichia coli]HAN7283597.1 DUF551 domain-containing protein [Escherichia coli]HAX7793429.1 DUF551 domain-containing protein [Escherichia coli]HBK9440862.1 DUF551 domain-containing protein [Escherichia coli]HCD6639381.1 DUF551 domain-containing protein [Escherichia coli]
MTTITKERLLTIKQWRETYGPGSNVVLPAEEAEELARIALASLEAEAVMFCISGQNVDSEEHVSTSKAVVDAWVEEWNQVDGSPGEPLYKTMPLYYHAALPAPVVPDEMYWQDAPVEGSSKAAAYATGWNACRAAMLHSAEPASNHEELPLDYLQGQKDGLEWAAQLAEANHPQTGDWLYDDPLELAKAIRKGPDMPEFDGPTPVTPDGWISCSERMPNDAQWCVVNTEYGYYVQCRSEGQGWLGDDISIPECDVINWMPLPEPPQEVNRG